MRGGLCPGDAALLLGSRRGSGQVQGSEGPVGTAGRVAMGVRRGRDTGLTHWGLRSLGPTLSEAGTSRAQPSPEPEAASPPTAQEGPSFIPVLFLWKSLVTGLCGAPGTGREDFLPQREDWDDGSVVIPYPPHSYLQNPGGTGIRPSTPLLSWASRARVPLIPSLVPLPAHSQAPRASSPLTHR